MKIFSVFSLWAPVVGWAGVIFTLSSIPSLSSGLGAWDFFLRKGAHVVEFAILNLLMLRALRPRFLNSNLKPLFFWSSTFSILYAISDEFHQSFVPGRGPSVADVLVDCMGVALSLILFKKFLHSRKGTVN